MSSGIMRYLRASPLERHGANQRVAPGRDIDKGAIRGMIPSRACGHRSRKSGGRKIPRFVAPYEPTGWRTFEGDDAMKPLTDFIGDQEIAALEGPLGQAVGLPGRVFSAEFFEVEQRTLFPRVWCPVAFASDIPDPGDAVPVELAGWPIVLLRGEDGEIRAFLNICRHRAMRVVTQPAKRCKSFTCPWHAWTYDLAGRLIATPKLGGDRLSGDEAFPTAGLALMPVRVDRWLDLIFVNIDGKAPPLDEHLRPLEDLL